MLQKLVKRMKGEGGFTLIELLVVIIIIAILAAIAIPTFLGQRQKAQDAAAKSLVRNAMTSMESAYVDTRDFGAVDDAALAAIEPSINFSADTGGSVAGIDYASADGASGPATAALANDNAVNWAGFDQVYTIASQSVSDNVFAVYVNKSGTEAKTLFSKSIDGGTTWTAGW